MSLAAIMTADPIETICQQGCRYTLEVIRRLEQGDVVDELQGLDAASQAKILEELRSIMAVYDFRTCNLK